MPPQPTLHSFWWHVYGHSRGQRSTARSVRIMQTDAVHSVVRFPSGSIDIVDTVDLISPVDSKGNPPQAVGTSSRWYQKLFGTAKN